TLLTGSRPNRESSGRLDLATQIYSTTDWWLLVLAKSTFCDKLRFMKRLNWQIWAGFVLSLVAGLSYPFVFARWAITREFPWVNLILFAIAFALLFLGLRRAFKPDKRLFAKIFSSLAAAFGLFL